MKRLGLSATLLALLGVAAGCWEQPQEPPAVDIGVGAPGPEIPTEDVADPQDSASGESVESPVVEQSPGEMPATPSPTLDSPAPTSPSEQEEAAEVKEMSGEDEAEPLVGPELRLPSPEPQAADQ